MPEFRVGNGFDVHSFVEGRPLILGGIQVPYALGLLGHSDADVLVHAVMDAMLGAVGLPDIGNLFPDADPTFKGADSICLLEKVWAQVTGMGWQLSNLDSIVIAEQPKLKSYIPMMREKISAKLNVSVERVNIKATTTEQLGFTGRGEGIAAQAVILIYKEG